MDNPAGTVKKRSVVLAGHRTSISLEAEFWQALRDVAGARLLSVNALVASVDAARGPARPTNLSSALRVFILITPRPLHVSDVEHLTGTIDATALRHRWPEANVRTLGLVVRSTP